VEGSKTFILNDPACVGNPEVLGKGFSRNRISQKHAIF
jgi:hypothetical protein